MILDKMGLTPLSAEQLSEGLESGRVRAVVILAGAPSVQLPPSCAQALPGLELLVVVDVLSSELSAMADIVLPGLTALEKHGTTINAGGDIRRLRAAVRPLAGALGELEILQRLARAQGADWNYPHPRQLAHRLTPLLGTDYARAWSSSREAAVADGQPFGGAWSDWQRRRGLLHVADHTKGGADVGG